MTDIYDADILVWSERQAALLRRRAANAIDWDNIAEEIEDVGKSALRSVRSCLLQALLHDLQAEAWPLTTYVAHWRSEAQVARINAAGAYSPGMRRLIDVPGIYAQALSAMPECVDGQPPLPLPAECPVSLDDLLAPSP